MNECIKTLLTRRSCRKYLDRAVPDEILEQIAEAGTFAATGMGRQSPVILVVKDKTIRDKISKLNAAVLNSNDDPFYGAPNVMVVLADRSIGTYIYDGSLVMGNLMNAAESLGVSSCWIHRAKEVFETEEGKEILKAAGIEGEYEGIGNLILGYDNQGKSEARPRKKDYIYWI